MKSESFKLSKPMLSLLEKHGITIATPVQRKIIPAISDGRDVLAQSETGSGKTLSFAIPIIEKTQKADGLTSLVLVPTRELCVQVTGEFMKFSQGKLQGITAIYGGVSMENQIRKIKHTNIIVATPGRLIDLLDRGVVKLEKIRFLVFDEADRMLDMGFIPDIERILKRMPQKKQTLLFSATVSKEIARLSQKYLDNPVHVSFESAIKPEFLRQTYYQTNNEQKIPLLIHLLKHERDLALVFCNRKHVTAKLAKKLFEQGINAKCLHGDMTQGQRERVTSDFRRKKISVLIATDVASRGLHIEDISHVYNFEIPKDVESYTHRVGRTARAGKKGEAISLVTGEDRKFFKQILFNHGGSITLKSIDNIRLPKSEQPVADFKKKLSELIYQPEDRKPKYSDDRKPKYSDDRKPKYSDDRKPKYSDDRKPKYSDDRKPKDKYGRESEKPDVKKLKTFGQNAKPFDKRKSNSPDNSKSAGYGKKISKFWEDRKPKFWSEGKSNSRLNKKH